MVDLATGRADALSGRFLTIFDDLGALLSHLQETESENLYSLRARKLDEERMPSLLAAVLQEGEQRGSKNTRKHT